MRAMHIRRAFRLGRRGNRVFFRLVRTGGGLCFSVSTVARGDFGGAACPNGPFPSPNNPVLDLSIYESASHTERAMTLYRAEGVTADGVADVDFLGSIGSILAHAVVVGNIFSINAPPHGEVRGLVAHDATGHVVFQVSF
jgi:hypothetical protein